MKRKFYSISDEGRFLFKTETYDEKSSLVASTDHQEEPEIVITNKYDNKSRLVESLEEQGDIMLAHYFYTYDEAGNLISLKHFIDDELFREEKSTYSENGHVTVLLEDEVEIRRNVKTVINANTIKYENWDQENEALNSDIIQKTIVEGEVSTITTSDPDGTVLQTETKTINAEGKTSEVTIRDADGEITDREFYEYENGKLKVSESGDHIVKCEYDEHGNETLREVVFFKDNRFYSDSSSYDEHNRLIRRSGTNGENFGLQGGKKYEIEIDYEV